MWYDCKNQPREYSVRKVSFDTSVQEYMAEPIQPLSFDSAISKRFSFRSKTIWYSQLEKRTTIRAIYIYVLSEGRKVVTVSLRDISPLTRTSVGVAATILGAKIKHSRVKVI